MAKNLRRDVKILAIIDALLIIGVIYMSLLVLPYLFPPKDDSYLQGKLIYLDNLSNPSNSSKGVWFKITLENPEKAELTQIVLGAVLSNGAHIYFNFRSDNFTATHGNYTAQFYDENNDGYVSTGDEFHIYGAALENADFYFHVSGFKGEMREKI